MHTGCSCKAQPPLQTAATAAWLPAIKPAYVPTILNSAEFSQERTRGKRESQAAEKRLIGSSTSSCYLRVLLARVVKAGARRDSAG
jgi:hypothetical protein